MATIDETIPSLGDVPTTADPATFDARADTLLGTALPAFRTAVNVWAGEANALGADVTTKSETATTASATAVSAKDAAVAAANYVGEWSAQSGAATVPTAVSNNDLVYGLKVDVADITAVEPGVTSGWETTWLVIYAPASTGIIPIGEKQSISSLSAVDISLTGGYDEYVIKFWTVIPATNGAALLLRTSTDAGATFDSGASDYLWGFSRNNTGGGSTPGLYLSGGAGDAQFVVSANTSSSTGMVNTAGYGTSGEIRIFKPSQTGATLLKSNALLFVSTTTLVEIFSGGARVALADVDAVRLFFSSGNMASGEYQLYGVATQ